jgi:hypothetical protein
MRSRSYSSLAYPPLALAGALLLGGCGGDSLTRTFGLTRDAPDEFSVTTRAPLSMPPQFTLRPPRPGAPRPQEQSDREQAELALAPEGALGNAPSPGVTPGQEALLQAAGPAAPAGIRREIDQDQQLDRPRQGFADKMLFWQTPPPAGTQIDAQKETQRLRENAALGKDPTVGDTPIIQPPKKGFLQGLFGIF